MAEPVRFFTTEKIGPKRTMTPDGFLVCHDVPIARTGWQDYASYEVAGFGLTPDSRGIVSIRRDPDDVFCPNAVSSFNGKDVTLQHPDDFVSPQNWRELSMGHVHEPRQGTGDLEGRLVADLMVKDPEMIRKIVDGEIREVSCGYTADYEPLEPGKGRQFNIRGNHVALVDAGRCGSACAIGDEKMVQKTGWLDRLRAAAKAKDAEEMTKVLGEVLPTTDDPVPGGGASGATTNHFHIGGNGPTGGAAPKVDAEIDPAAAGAAAGAGGGEGGGGGVMEALAAIQESIAALGARMDKYETAEAEAGGYEIDAEPGEEEAVLEQAEDAEEERKPAEVGDSMALQRGFQRVLSQAEILVPGIKLPVFDAKIVRAKTVDAMCKMRRLALTRFATTDAAAPILAELDLPPAKLPTLDCATVAVAFNAAAKTVANSRKTQTNDGVKYGSGSGSTYDMGTKDADAGGGKPATGSARTIAQINADNRKRHGFPVA